MATIDSVKLPDNSTYDLTDTYSGYQTETLATPITVDGTSETTVEGALGAVNDYADKIKDNLAGRNLVDNGWFTVNQRGFTSGNFANNYPADRWTTSYSDISDGTISNDGNGLITITGASTGSSTLYQVITSPKLGKTYTLSALIDGEIYKGTATLNSTSDQIMIAVSDKATLSLYFSGGKWYAQVAINSGKTLVLRAVKLEVGSISTLANDVAPDYALELAKCQTSTATPSDTYANQGQLMTSALQGVLGAKNQSNQTFTSQTIDGVYHTPNADRSLTVTTNGASTSTVVAGVISTSFIVKKGTYLFTFVKDSDEPTTSPYSIIARDSSNTYICGSTDTKAQRTITFAQDTTIHYECYCGANKIVSDVTFYPMIRDAHITDPTYQPFAMTNRELTEEVNKVNNQISKYPLLGDCAGSDANLNSLVQTYSNSLPIGIHICVVTDNVGTSVISGGTMTILILKSDTGYYPIFGMKYLNGAGARIYAGSFYNGTFNGFSVIA